jgi:energy-coupling factor transporter transmembrane protein EcfT
MIEYVYYDTWWMWNSGYILFSLLLSLIFYVVLIGDGELKLKVSRPRWIASVPCVFSIVYVGLFFIIPLVCFVVLSFWIDKKKR